MPAADPRGRRSAERPGWLAHDPADQRPPRDAVPIAINALGAALILLSPGRQRARRVLAHPFPTRHLAVLGPSALDKAGYAEDARRRSKPA